MPFVKSAPFALRACAASMLLIAGAAGANPTGGVVVNGQVSFSQAQPNQLTVTNSPGAIINWQGFSIGANETTRFNQQSASSAVLNRVVGGDVSSILGALTSNGKVFLVNPNGIIFGAGSRIDTAGFSATTGNLSNADFLAGSLGVLSSATSLTAEGVLTVSGGTLSVTNGSIVNTGT